MKKSILITVCLAVFSFTIAVAQVTTSELRGTITDSGDMELPGANVIVTHVPTGTKYGTMTLDNGKYYLVNLRVGGPYKVEVSYIGFKTVTKQGIYLQLGEKLKLNVSLVDDASVLSEVVITGSSKESIINSDRTGTSTRIGKEQIKNLPTISRSISDFTRLTPSADGNSFGGGNNKMNNLSLDGSIFNNPFGLDGGTPGSQTNAQPISLDAIEQIQIELAPYDVTRSGFTGASINAVTKSGTNQFHGSLFGFFRNESMTGDKVENTEVFQGDLKHIQSGFSIGGPIIENKLFFFANAEVERRDDLVTGFRARLDGETAGDGISRVLASDLDLVSDALANQGYNTGGYQNILHSTNNEKFIIKLDWNINDNHSLSAIYNSLDARREKPAHPTAFFNRGPNQTTLQFENSAYEISNKLQSGMIELKSRFGNRFSNNLQVGYTHFDDFRTPLSDPAPMITILKDGSPYIIAGHEPFSVHNTLDQKVIQITNNFNIYAGNHKITIGAAFEKFEFDNSFNLGTYGAKGLFFPTAGSITEFLDYANDPGGFAADYQNAKDAYTAGVWSLAETNVGQFSVYVQDEFSITDDFVLTYGVRVDKPEFFDTKDKIAENIERNPAYDDSIDYFDVNGNPTKYNSLTLPKETPLVSPRIGFNWDVKGDRTMQFRGGLGIFTGRFPFVWIGNQVQNVASFFYTTSTPDFQFPQTFRTNLGFDKKFENGWTVTTDVLVSKNMRNIFAVNIGLTNPSGSLQGPGSRPIYSGADITNHAWAVTNTSLGEVFNASVQVKKQFDNGLAFSIAYDYLDAKDAISPTEEITNATFGANPNFGNVNRAKLSNSRFGHKNRVVGSATKKFVYGNGKWATSLAAFFEYTESGRFSYVYGGDINGDGAAQNDLIYIPTAGDIGIMNFVGTATEQTAQRVALESFINQSDYLSGNRGDFAKRNAMLAPWFSNWDIRIAQDYNFGKDLGKKIQFTIDILNVGNLLSSDWGVRQLPVNTQPIGVLLAGDVATYSFDTTQTSSFTNDLSLLSRWQMQFGLRYSF
ncbi:MAG: TonB-dependent receptor [Flavobacteriaceae bacterium]|nr:MAG: TonB-dependent receptor [Flavobacteriaceae bacterium]